MIGNRYYGTKIVTPENFPFRLREASLQEDPYTYRYFQEHLSQYAPGIEGKILVPEEFVPVQEGKVPVLGRRPENELIEIYTLGSPELKTRYERRYLNQRIGQEIRNLTRDPKRSVPTAPPRLHWWLNFIK